MTAINFYNFQLNQKVAPGMSSTFYIHFTPDAIKDYSHQLICTSERERILVPIKCIGARGLLDFPDLISLEDCPVKMSKSKTLLIRNIGTVRVYKGNVSVGNVLVTFLPGKGLGI